VRRVGAGSPSLALENRRVLVAGAGGLGGACVAGFAESGARVVAADAGGQRLRDLDGELDLAAVLTADLSRAEECRTVAAKAVATLGGLDVFVHALGSTTGGHCWSSVTTTGRGC
jgi:gluconate 5-dehydrogenase